MSQRRFLIVAVTVLIPAGMFASAHAQSTAPIYMCTDEFGRHSFTNVPAEMKGHKCVRQTEPVLPVSPGGKPAAKSAATPTPADFPRVGADAQKARDDVRHKVLMEELAGEQKLLDKANQDLNDARTARPGEQKSSAKYLARVDDAEKAVQRHRANVESLQREIGKLK
jgi:hypothetical protein